MSPADPPKALRAVAPHLACPECGQGLALQGRSLRCARNHHFDLAKQGYVTLLTGAATTATGDTAAMLDAREAFQAGQHFAPIAAAAAAAMPTCTDLTGPLLEIGAGTGYYLSQVLEALPQATGIALDVAKPAGRRCARAHPRAAALVADVWRGLPLRSHTVGAVLSAFAPRNPDEVARVLHPGGHYVVITPTERHLAELITPLGMVRVDPDKEARLAAALATKFSPVRRDTLEFELRLSASAMAQVVAMGPSSHHASAAAQRIAALPDPYPVTASVVLGVYRTRS